MRGGGRLVADGVDAERLDQVDDAPDDTVVPLGDLTANHEIGEPLEERRESPGDPAVASDPGRGHACDTLGEQPQRVTRKHADEHPEALAADDGVRPGAVVEREIAAPQDRFAAVLHDERLAAEHEAELVLVALRPRRESRRPANRVRGHLEPAQRERPDRARLHEPMERGTIVRPAFERHEELGARCNPQLRPVLDRHADVSQTTVIACRLEALTESLGSAGDLPKVRDGEPRRREVLQRLRRPADRPRHGAKRGAEDRLGSLLRPGRLHGSLGGGRPGGCSRSHRPVSRETVGTSSSATAARSRSSSAMP